MAVSPAPKKQALAENGLFFVIDAINHEMQVAEVQVNVGAIILSPGFELFNAELRGEFGYGVYENVITSLQFERMLSASGPFIDYSRIPLLLSLIVYGEYDSRYLMVSLYEWRDLLLFEANFHLLILFHNTNDLYCESEPNHSFHNTSLNP